MSQTNDNDIQLPNLNSSRQKLNRKSPYKPAIKNRRNLSIRQSWDKPRFNQAGKTSPEKGSMTTKNSGTGRAINQRVLARHNIDTSMKFKPNAKDFHSPTHDGLDTVESPKAIPESKKSDYYGTYAKVAE